LFKYIEVLHRTRKRKYLHLKLLKTKFLAVFATPKKFPGGTDDELPSYPPLCW
jgi:hypothetical protein